MRIGLDYLPATTHWPGVGRYARELTRALVRLPEAPRLRLFEWGAERRTIGERALGLAQARRAPVRFNARAPRRVLDALARFGLAADRCVGGLDLFHRMHLHGPPIARARCIWAAAELPRAGSREAEALRARLARLDGVLAASATCAAELQREYGVEAARIHRVRTGCEHWRRELRELPPRDEPGTVIVLGALRAARRHAAILAAFERLHARARVGRMAWIGPRGDAAGELEQRIASSPARAAVECHAQPIEARMPELMARASLLVHLSEGEQTPVTPLEACSFGTPVLASPLPAFVEALGEAAHWASDEAAADPEELARAMEAALASARDPAACARRVELARAYDWEQNARATLAAYERCLASPRLDKNG